MDETNKKLLALLREDARMSAAALGQKLGLSRTAVRERMKRLERDKIILGYTVLASTPEDAHVITAPRSCRSKLVSARARQFWQSCVAWKGW
jgi:DNA-binding Lrp family transcriptional regulator